MADMKVVHTAFTEQLAENKVSITKLEETKDFLETKVFKREATIREKTAEISLLQERISLETENNKTMRRDLGIQKAGREDEKAQNLQRRQIE